MRKSERNQSVLIANETLYQLSYTPVVGEEISTPGRFFIKANQFAFSELNHHRLALLAADNTSDAKERLQQTLSRLRCAL